MRNPAGKIFVYSALLAAGVLLVYLGATRWDGSGESWFGFVVMLAGLLLVPFGAVYLVMALLHTRGRSKLVAGRGLIARWHVSAGEWERFVRFDRIRARSAPGLHNDLQLKGPQERGVDILVGRTSALVGDSYHVLRRGGLPGLAALYWLPPPAEPECLEFHVRYAKRYGPGTPMTLRLPVPASARGEGIKVYEHFEPLLRPKPSLAVRRPRLVIAIALAVALIGAIAAAWGLTAARAGERLDAAAMVAGVVGAVAALPALGLALAAFVLSRRRPG